MASASVLHSEENFTCSICLDVFTSPVTTLCGHNFCRACITRSWDDQVRYKCPLCNKLFRKRPALRVNTLLSEMVDQFRRSVRVEEQPCVEPGEVPCDICTGTQLKAVKSCLVCLSSYCRTHLEPHQRVRGLKRHQLVEPMDLLADWMCKKHDRLLELFCQTEQVYVCQSCTEGDHRSHPVVPLKEDYEMKMSQLGKIESEVQQMIQERQRKIKEIKDRVKCSKANADIEIAECVKILTTLTHMIQKCRDDQNQKVKEKLESAEKEAEGLIKELEQEIEDLTKRSSEVKQLSHTEDHLHFLQTFRSLKNPPHTRDWKTVDFFAPSVTLRKSLDQLEEKLYMEMKKWGAVLKECEDMNLDSLIQVIHDNRPLNRKATMKRLSDACDLTLDPNTAHTQLCLSEDHRTVRRGGSGEEEQSYPDHPERFDCVPQVLCREALMDRCYWEVEWSGSVHIGVTDRAIERRKGEFPQCLNAFGLGWNNMSFCLSCDEEYYSAFFNGSKIWIGLYPDGSNRVGVYLDRPARTLSFYRVDPGVGGSPDTLTNILSFGDLTFIRDLLAGFRLDPDSSVSLCQL